MKPCSPLVLLYLLVCRVSGIAPGGWKLCMVDSMDEQNRRQCPVPATYKYIIYQQEMCPSTGRLHYQGFVYFTNPRSFDSVRREFGGMTHVEVCHDITASIAYCSKEDTRVGTTFEDAIKPECARPKGWWQQISIAQLWEEEPDWMLRHHAAVTAYHKQIKKVSFVRPKPQVIVLWGPPGTGKSHTARAICDNFYVKPTGNWWDGYYGQDLVIFDDFYGTEKYCDMLRWLSENPIKVPIKGSMTDLLATKFVITSNVEPQRCIAQLWEEEPEWMLKHHAAVTAYNKQLKKVSFVRPKPQVIVLWGPPGTGKSHTARSIRDNFYVKPTGNWWDGYFGQDLVIFDDFYGTEKYCDMLRWLSENPIKVPIKGSMTDLLATKFVITSNVEPQRCASLHIMATATNQELLTLMATMLQENQKIMAALTKEIASATNRTSTNTNILSETMSNNISLPPLPETELETDEWLAEALFKTSTTPDILLKKLVKIYGLSQAETIAEAHKTYMDRQYPKSRALYLVLEKPNKITTIDCMNAAKELKRVNKTIMIICERQGYPVQPFLKLMLYRYCARLPREIRALLCHIDEVEEFIQRLEALGLGTTGKGDNEDKGIAGIKGRGQATFHQPSVLGDKRSSFVRPTMKCTINGPGRHTDEMCFLQKATSKAVTVKYFRNEESAPEDNNECRESTY
ncbi:replication associated protein [Gregarina niphandrodes]|uniref:ATP-dependent helicase Rep n=1 Tax=Gregarina niphandrodes TaxID=110365 RepID=A0A023B1R5_GRENI|nr:replication associated protein [Gregarina niphandrodes]EZG49013.1 replication associated protein [Gregarina niphandrodes]|eukprot:XP_011132061.1 replication associated protein [Gregarina niphandrodes]